MKKNEGFSLVELIVVVAIMAVLIGVLAPAYLGYVEKTRKGTDENACEEIRGAVEKAIAGDIAVYDEIAAAITAASGSSIDLTWTDATTAPAIASQTSYTNLNASLTEVFGTKTFDMKSKAYTSKSCKVTITSASGNAFNVTCAIYDGTTKVKDIK